MLGIFLSFNNGLCEEALEFYTKAFEVEPRGLMRYHEIPPSDDFHMHAGDENLITYVDFEVEGGVIMMADTSLHHPMKIGDNFTININSKDANKLKTYFDKISEDGKVTMPFSQTFWSLGYGSLIDKYGIRWSFNCIE